MNGRRDDGEHAGMDGSAPTGSRSPSSHVDLIAQVLREEPDLAAAVEALPSALDPVDLPDGAWDRLAVALVELTPTAHDPAATGAEPAAATGPVTGHAPRGPTRAGRGGRTGSSGGPRPGWNWAHPLTWLSAALVAAVVIGLGTWGALQAGERTRLSDEQRVLAYWMANPELRMVSLREIGSSATAGGEADSGRLGVVCILPDGRALLLQPAPARRGTSYVVVGRQADSEADQTVLGSGTGNVIRFDLAGAERVVVMLATGGGEPVPIAWAAVN